MPKTLGDPNAVGTYAVHNIASSSLWNWRTEVKRDFAFKAKIWNPIANTDHILSEIAIEAYFEEFVWC